MPLRWENGAARKAAAVLLLLLPVVAAAAACGRMPSSKSGLVLRCGAGEGTPRSAFLVVTVACAAGAPERWGFFTGGGYPVEVEAWSDLEGECAVMAEGFSCEGGGCREAWGGTALPEAASRETAVTLRRGEKRRAELLLERAAALRCGDGVIDPGEECDPPADGGEGDGCAPDCSYPLRVLPGRAGGAGDAPAGFPAGDGFAVAWSDGGGDRDDSPDAIGAILFDGDGDPAAGFPAAWPLASCTGAARGVLAASLPAVALDGEGVPRLAWSEAAGADEDAFCIASAGVLPPAAPVRLPLAGARAVVGEMPLAFVGGGAHVALAARTDGLLFVHVLETGGGEASWQAAADPAGQAGSGEAHLAAGAGSVVAVAWTAGEAPGGIAAKLRRWSFSTVTGLVPLDAAPVALAGLPAAEGGGEGPLLDAAIVGGAGGTLVVAACVGGTAEARYMDAGAPASALSRVGLPGGCGAVEDVAGAGERAFVLVSLLDDGATCAWRLHAIAFPTTGGAEASAAWEGTGTGGEEGCGARLVPLGADRIAVVMRPVVAGAGELRVDIVSVAEL